MAHRLHEQQGLAGPAARCLARGLVVLAAGLGAGGCLTESIETTRARVVETHRTHAHERCLAAASLENYMQQCEDIGGDLEIQRRTYVCLGESGERNPSAMGDGPFCTCSERDADGHCLGDADCSAGIEERCAAVLSAEVRPLTHAELGERNAPGGGDSGRSARAPAEGPQ